MTKVGITGHQRLAEPADWNWVIEELNSSIARLPRPIVGITSLAIGADQLFAQSVLNVGGTLEAVVPFAGYERTFQNSDRSKFDQFRRKSSRVEVLTRAGTDEECYLNAGKRVVELSDILIAVWDGRPAKGLGGTADIVSYAATMHRPLIHIDPAAKKVKWKQ